MDLVEIPGIGPAYRERLREAGVRDVEDLARAPDLPALAEWTSIPHAKLAAFHAHALALRDEEGGLVLDAPPRRAKGEPLLALKKAGIRVVALAGAIGATFRAKPKSG